MGEPDPTIVAIVLGVLVAYMSSHYLRRRDQNTPGSGTRNGPNPHNKKPPKAPKTPST